MPLWFVILIAVFAVGAVILIRRQIGGAIFERLPFLPGESVLWEEEGLKVFHKIRQAGQVTTSRVRVVVTDRRILIATGGPEGKYKFVLLMILDYKTPALPSTSVTGYDAYYSKFHLEAGYPTYFISPRDVHLVEKKGGTAVQITVPFPEHGSLYLEPEVMIYSKQPEKYREVFSG